MYNIKSFECCSVLFPGGDASFAAHDGYADAAWSLYNLALKKNQAGDYFPVWGTCLGFELLSYLAIGRVDILANCEAENVPLPLEFTSGGYSYSRLPFTEN